jgi:subtilase family serine protease
MGALAVAAGAAVLSVPVSARAEDPSRAGLPHGISRDASGRYYRDVCDHAFAYHCLAKRLLPPTYDPLTEPHPPGGGDECTCPQGQCGGSPQAISGTLTPKGILAAYSVPASSSAGGKIVAILDLPDATALKDVNVYRKEYGIPELAACPGNGLPDPNGGTPCFAAVDETGNVTSSAGDCPAADGETGIDMEMISAGCPDCSILLVQMTTAFANGGPSDTDFVTGAKAAIKLGAVAVSISFGGGENVGFDPTGPEFTVPGHLVLAAAGDDGYLNGEPLGEGTPSWPASAADVLGIGGTTLQQNGSTYSEVVWNDGQPSQTSNGGAGGSGCSTEITMPAFQKTFLAANPGAFGSCNKRASVDMAAAAEYSLSGGGPFSGAISEYDSINDWSQVVGTSAASPMVAGIFTRLGLIGPVSANIGWVYENITSFNDVTSGSNDLLGTCATVLCKAGKGWDGPTGVGTPNGANLALLVAPPADAGAEGGDEDGGTAAEAPAKKGGCGCITAGAPEGSAPLLLAVGVGMGAFAVRRRRRGSAS